MKKCLWLCLLLWPTGAAAQAVIVPSPVPALTANCVLQYNSGTGLLDCNALSAVSQPLTASLGLIADNTTPTKILKFNVAAITASTTRTITWPDANITVPSTIASLGANTFTGLQTANGGLASTTGTFSSILAVTTADPTYQAIAINGSSTNAVGVRLTNTGGNAYVGLDSSTGAGFGSSAYGLVLEAPTGSAITFMDGTAVNASISATGLLAVNGTGPHTFGPGTGLVDLQLNGGVGSNLGAVITLKRNSVVQAYIGTHSGSLGGTSDALALYGGSADGVELFAAHASGAIRFYSGGATEVARFASDGTLHMGAATVAGGSRFGITYNGAAFNGITLNDSSSTSGTQLIEFRIAGTTVLGSINRNAATSAVLYNTTSDIRLKRDLGVATDTTVLERLVIHEFAWLEGGAVDRGVFAQEAYAVTPRAVSVGGDARYPDGHLVKPWGVDYSKFVADLIVGWQQHDARLAALEAQVKELAK